MSVPDAVVQRLCALSERQALGMTDVGEWPTSLDPEAAWYTSPELISLHGTARYDELDERARKRLSFYEAVNFFSLNIHGEQALTDGLRKLIDNPAFRSSARYLQHFLDEEERHTEYFRSFCERYACVYPQRKLSFPCNYEAGEEEFLFFAKVLMFEEVVDVFNIKMAADERLHPLIRRINFLHHADEVRHLAFGRLMIDGLYKQHAPGWSEATRERVAKYLRHFLVASLREYFNKDAYQAAGIADGFELAREAAASDATRQRHTEATRRIQQWLDNIGIRAREESSV